PGVPEHRRPRLRLGVPRSDRFGPHAVLRRAGECDRPAQCRDAVQPVRGRLSGEDSAAGPHAQAARETGGTGLAPVGRTRWAAALGLGRATAQPLRPARPDGRPPGEDGRWSARLPAQAAAGRQRLDPGPGHARARRKDLPRALRGAVEARRTMSARENILRRIRAANGKGGTASTAEREAVIARLRTHARGPLPSMDWDPVPRFQERCIVMMSTVDEVASLRDVPAAVARYLSQNQLPARGACWPEFASLDWAGAGLEFDARPARGNDMVGITGTFCAIAENGTLMML